MPASLPPPPPPRPPGDAARVRELAMVLVLTPVVVGVLSRLGVPSDDKVIRALATGAIYLALPCWFGVLVLVVTRATWAGWIAVALQVSMLGILVGADFFYQRTFTLRAAVAVAALAYAAARQRAWEASRKVSLRSLPGPGGG